MIRTSTTPTTSYILGTRDIPTRSLDTTVSRNPGTSLGLIVSKSLRQNWGQRMGKRRRVSRSLGTKIGWCIGRTQRTSQISQVPYKKQSPPPERQSHLVCGSYIPPKVPP